MSIHGKLNLNTHKVPACLRFAETYIADIFSGDCVDQLLQPNDRGHL